MTVAARLIDSGAVFSPDDVYRYRLWRAYESPDDTGSTMLFVMLNPSVADAREDDPTIRRCIGFALANECSRMEVVNLFAYRETRPKELRAVARPIGKDNDRYIQDAAQQASRIVCAWGADGGYMDRGIQVRRNLLAFGHRLFCLGATVNGQPRHPLYVRGDTALRQWGAYV